MNWTIDELHTIGAADELDLSSLRQDGSLRRPVTMWVVRVGDDMYVRAVNGPTGAWFRGTQTRHEGRIQSGGVERDVTFIEEGASAIHDRIDAAYRAKYSHYPKEYVDACVTPRARAATIKLVPRDRHSG